MTYMLIILVAPPVVELKMFYFKKFYQKLNRRRFNMTTFFAAIHFMVLALIIGVALGVVGLVFLLKKYPGLKTVLGI